MMLSTQHYIDGRLVTAEGSDVFDVIDPATETRLGQIADATSAEVDRAVAIANAAQRRWDRTSTLERAELLHEVAASIRSSRAALDLLWHDGCFELYDHGHCTSLPATSRPSHRPPCR